MASIPPNQLAIRANLKVRGNFTITGHPNLVLASRGDGNGSWRISYRTPEGKRRWFLITNDARNATFDDVKQAKDKFLFELRSQRVDPKARLDAEAEARRASEAVEADTFGRLFDDWLERHAKAKKKSWADDERLWHRHIKSRMAHRPAAKIKRTDLAAILDDIARAATPTQANKCQSLVSAVFTWGLNVGRVDNSPAFRLPKRAADNTRERVLTDDELRHLWAETADGSPISDAIRVLILTGQRRSEVAGMAASELDMANAAWVIPSARTKNKIIHRVPLCTEALGIIRRRMADGGRFVFAGRADTSTGFISPDAITRAMWKLKLGSPAATIHDLRRTVGTRMAEMRVPKDVRAAVLNHISGAKSSVTDAVYNQYEGETEKLRALRLWQLRLRNIVSGRKLHRLRWNG